MNQSFIQKWHNSAIKAENIKDGESPKNLMSWENLIKPLLTALICLFIVNTYGQTWQIGSPTAANVTATLNNGTLTISGTGLMQDWSIWGSPWMGVKDDIKSVIIHSGVSKIGNHAFIYCSNISSVTIPNTVNTIGNSAFSDCDGLRSIIIPNGVSSIEDGAFYSCKGLTSISISSTVISIGSGSFGFLGSLKDVTVNWTTPLSIINDVFAFMSIANINLHVPEGTQCEYADAPVWRGFNITPNCFEKEYEYDHIRESKHFVFEIPLLYLKKFPPSTFQRWLSHLDAAYESYAELTGLSICNGQKIKIVEASGTMWGWAWVYIGSPYIHWNPNCINFDDIDEYDDWSFGILHELGHLFDEGGLWNFHSEFWANTKMLYVLYDNEGSFVRRDNQNWTFATIQNDYPLNQYQKSLGKTPPIFSMEGEIQDHDAMTYMFIEIVKKIGWEPFKQTFRSYYNNSYPYHPYINLLCTENNNATKFNDFLDRLSYFSGENVRNVFTTEQLAAVEAAYPCAYDINNIDILTTPTTSWQTKSGSIQSGGCYVYQVSVTSGQKYTFKTGCGDGAATNFDSEIFLYDHSGSFLTWVSHGSCESGGTKIEDYQFNYNGYAYVRVKGYGPLGGSTTYGNYTLAYIITSNTGNIGSVDVNLLKIFPNPTKDELFINSDLQIKKIEIYSLTGILLILENVFTEKISVSTLPAGIYLVKIYTDKELIIRKIVKD